MPPPTMLSSAPEAKLTLPIFLKMLTSGGMSMDKAMTVASKMYALVSLLCIAFELSYKIDIRLATHLRHLASLQMAHFLRSM